MTCVCRRISLATFSARVVAIRAEPVREIFQGKTVWEGDVKVFRVRGHPQAQFAYAWTREDDDGTKHHVAVLGVPPINSAQNTVKAAVMAHIEKDRQ